MAVVTVGRARNRRRALAIATTVLALGALAGGTALGSYLDIQPGQAMTMTMSKKSAYYRKVLFEKYLDIAIDHAWFGWGLTTWPKVPGMESIDNYYLLISLMHGLPAMLMLVAMLLDSAALCIRRGMTKPVGSDSPLFTFAGIFIAIFVLMGTVYLGEKVLPTLFFMLGWAQTALRSDADLPLRAKATTSAPQPFRGVIR